MEMERFKPNLFIKGIVESKDEDVVAEVKSFFKNQLLIAEDIPIKHANRTGKGKVRSIFVALENSRDKAQIYGNITNLQDKKNELDKYYRVEDQLPARQCATQSKHRHAMWRNKQKKLTAEHLELSVKKGHLLVNNEQFRPKIRKPDTHILLKLQPDEISALKECGKGIRMGREVVEGTSRFQGYVCDINNVTEVNKAYEFVQFANMGARHIICAFRLPGSNFIENQDYFDDDEHEGGKTLLDYMVYAKLVNRAIFVTRHYDGTHIGPQHFENIVKAAKLAVNQKPFNRVTGEFQFSWSQSRKSARGGIMPSGQRIPNMDDMGDWAATDNIQSESDSEVLCFS